MFRGFRWQLIALLLALVVLLAAAMFRLNRETTRLQPAAPTPATVINASHRPAATTEARPATSAISAPPNAFGPPVDATAPYREGLVGDIHRLNPLFAQLNSVDRDISSLIFEGLFTTNEYGEVVPQLAEQLVISADGIEYVAKLRQDARWQDGTPFSAADVVYTMSLLSDPAYAQYSPLGEFFATVETQKLSDHLLRFRLAQPLSSFPYLLTIGILPEHALRNTTIAQLAQHPFNLSPIGTGPYQLAELRLGAGDAISVVELARSPVFLERQDSAASYALSRLSFHLYPSSEAALAAYVSGAVNALANIAPREQLLTLPSSRVFTQIAPSIAMLIFNWEEAQLAERRLRQALSLSLDVPALTAKHLGADATYADSPYTPGSSVYLPQAVWHSVDLVHAQTLLDAAGISPAGESAEESDADAADADSSAARLSLLVEDRPALTALADDIASQWRLLGIQAQVDAVGVEDLDDRLSSGRFQTAIVELPLSGDFDLYRYWHPAKSGNGQNYGGVANHEVAELIEQARREIYADRRVALLQQFQDAFAEQAIAIPLYYPLFTFVVSEQIEGIQLGFLASPADRFRGINAWRQAAAPS